MKPFPGWSARRRALTLTLISLCAWEVWEGLRVFHHPWGDLKGANYTDHFSHMNAARAFPLVGLDLWRRPIDQLFRKLTPPEQALLPQDLQAGASYSGGVFTAPGWPAEKPLVTSWPNNPRNYPPGDLLLVAPVAALYQQTSLSFTAANRLLLMLFLLYAHVAIFFLFESVLVSAPASPMLERARQVTAALVYFEVIHWTLEGFYDAAALAPLILCARFLGQRRGLAALVAFCAASFIHFRVFFFAPWAVYALVIVVRERQWRGWHLVDLLALALGAVLGAISLGVFFVLWPAVQHLPIHNFVNLASSPGWLVCVLLPLLLAGAALAGRELWRLGAVLDLVQLCWMVLMMVALHESYPWHLLLAVIPWLCAPPSVEEPSAQVRIHWLRIAVLVGSACLVFGYELFSFWHLWPL